MAPRLTALVAALLLGVTPAAAGHLLLSANDGKYPNIDGVYKVADPPAPDTLTILDVRSFPPRAVAEIEVQHTVTSPPQSVALTPDEKLALVSVPNRVDPNDKTKLVLEDALQGVDLEASPPRVIARVPLGSHPLGLSVSRAGDLALVAHPDDGWVSVLTINGKIVTRVGSSKVGDEKSRVSHVAISPDGRLAVVGNVGRGSGDADTVTVIDMTLRPIRAVDHIAVGPWAEWVAFSPAGKWLAVAISNGTKLPKGSPFRAEQGRLLLYSVQGTKLVKVAEAPTGRNTQGVTFTPDGKYIYVQNYVEQELAVFRPTATALEDTGTRVKVKGHPASIRIAP